ncbi:MauE/DoxX family redox-associated membrane protein [Pedobacter rhizosphaerae]|uniref:MauE/DoxX family redox-associated membrane protein n=1 Tax=Pedobacter rhizosphaerae TaxID=390241 RepID=UPI001C3124E8|nr:MauE/DoxX family redox-associated membrane protein [Pedobacter rhizosphaerae]
MPLKYGNCRCCYRQIPASKGFTTSEISIRLFGGDIKNEKQLVMDNKDKAKFDSYEFWLLLSSALLILLWGYAAFSKFADYGRFVAQMKLAPLPLMKHLAPVLGIVVPLTELVIIGLLFSERFRKTGLWLSFLLLLSFTVYISIMLLSGLSLPCTCGGLISKLGWRQHLIFNASFMLISLLPFLWTRIFSKVYSPRSIYK